MVASGSVAQSEVTEGTTSFLWGPAAFRFRTSSSSKVILTFCAWTWVTSRATCDSRLWRRFSCRLWVIVTTQTETGGERERVTEKNFIIKQKKMPQTLESEQLFSVWREIRSKITWPGNFDQSLSRKRPVIGQCPASKIMESRDWTR